MPSLGVSLQHLSDQPVVPCFHCTFLLSMPPSETSGSPLGARPQFFSNGFGLTPTGHRLGTPRYPVIRFRRDMHLAASLRFAFATACRVVRPSDGSDQTFAQP